MESSGVWPKLICYCYLVSASVQTVGILNVERDKFRFHFTNKSLALHILSFLWPWNTWKRSTNKWNENMNFFSCLNSDSLIKYIKVKFRRWFHWSCSNGQRWIRVGSTTSSIIGPDLVLILVTILYLAIPVFGSTYWFGCDGYPSSSKEITPLNIITSDLRTTIVCWGFPANLYEVFVSINSKWSSRLSRNIKLCLWHCFIRSGWGTSTLGINSKHSKFVSVSFQQSWNFLC